MDSVSSSCKESNKSRLFDYFSSTRGCCVKSGNTEIVMLSLHFVCCLLSCSAAFTSEAVAWKVSRLLSCPHESSGDLLWLLGLCRYDSSLPEAYTGFWTSVLLSNDLEVMCSLIFGSLIGYFVFVSCILLAVLSCFALSTSSLLGSV